MKTSSNSLFITMMILSTVSVMSSSTWLNMWVCLEINMMSFIPLMYNYKNMYMSQSMMMYFLVQSMSSMLFIMLILINMYFFKNQNLTQMMITLTMMIKMGAPPMHLWFVQILKKMSWTVCLMMLTWQKMAPMYITSLSIPMNKMMMMVICLSTITGAICGLNQTSIHSIMAYSSINHMGWMIVCTMCHKKSWIMYLAMYSMLMIIMCMFFYTNNIMYINQMKMFPHQILNKMLLITMILSLGGIPPFLGFLPKWMALNYMFLSNEIMIMLIMTISSLITLSYYMKMISSINLMMSHSQKWMLLSQNTLMTSMIMITNNLLPASLLLINFF